MPLGSVQHQETLRCDKAQLIHSGETSNEVPSNRDARDKSKRQLPGIITRAWTTVIGGLILSFSGEVSFVESPGCDDPPVKPMQLRQLRAEVNPYEEYVRLSTIDQPFEVSRPRTGQWLVRDQLKILQIELPSEVKKR
jgi:hypothetical protein